MIRRRKNRKQVRVVVGLSICLLVIMTVGYAAFSTKLTLTAKGNIKSLISVDRLKSNVVIAGDGLYVDTYEEGRYIYRGSSPNNYVKLNDELWRIVAIEKDNALKVVKSESIGKIPYDEATTLTSGPRYNDENTFCQHFYQDQYYGCSIWAAVNGALTSGSFSGTITQDATLKTYLNTTYYNSLSELAKSYIADYDHRVGIIGVSDMSLLVEREKKCCGMVKYQ
ncbi:MAG: hypothetical protein ACLTAK_02200 [Bacilli bacterium]